MPLVHTRSFVVPASAIDGYGHVNNIEYVRWMQDVAIEHVAAAGWPIERSFAAGVAWVARSHYVEYLRPAFVGESIALHTWLGSLTEKGWPRRYLFVRERDRKLLARAETLWVCVDAAKGRPVAAPVDFIAAFQVVQDEAAVLKELGL